MRRGSILAAVSIVAVLVGVTVIATAVNSPDLGSGEAVLTTDTPPARTATVSGGTGLIVPDASTLGIVVPAVDLPVGLEDGRAIGRGDAPATLTIWGDFQCPYCGKLTREVEPRLIADYVVAGKLRIVYRDWVFIGVESVAAAVAARCAGEQGAFWRYHDFLLWNQQGENKGGFSDERLDAIAKAVGLDQQSFHMCTLDTRQIAAVRAETEAGDEAKIGMTPTLVVDDNVMPGAPVTEVDYDHLRAVIEASIAAHAPGQPEASPGQS